LARWPERIHASAIAAGGRAAIIRGASGAGKSDLALRCLAQAPSLLLPHPVMLVGDDQIMLERRGDALFAAPAPALAGKLEVRGIGIVAVSKVIGEAEVRLVVDLVPAKEVERMPDPWPATALIGKDLPLLRLFAFENSAPLKLLMALQCNG